jgi:hypothetical protein
MMYQHTRVAPCKTHHLIEGKPFYSSRFSQVMKYHTPGFAPVLDTTGAYHIDIEGQALYPERYTKTFGFYEDRAAVAEPKGWFHLTIVGKPLYTERYDWCGNFQEGRCTVRDKTGSYFHIDAEGKRVYTDAFVYAGDYRDGFAVVQASDGKQTHIDRVGKFSHSLWFDALDVFHKGYARAKKGAGWFHIDVDGKELYSERYLQVEPFYNGFAYAETFAEKRCLIDESGTIVKELSKDRKDPFHQASAEMVSYWRLETLRAACRLSLFYALPTPLEYLMKWERLLLALEEMGFVCRKKGYWKATEKGEYFHTNHPYSLRGAIDLWDEEHQTSWKDLPYSLETGESAFKKQYGLDWFDYLAQDQSKCRHYHHILASYARRDYQELIDLSSFRSVVDLGGSTGTFLIELLMRYPHLKGELFDLPEVCHEVKVPPELGSRIRIVPGNFFKTWPPLESDVAILTRILHDWPDDKALEILRKIPCRTVYIIENLLDKTSAQGALLDLNMLVMTGGKERTKEEFEHLLKNSGWQAPTFQPLNEVAFVIKAER